MTQDRIFVSDKLFDLHQTYFTLHHTINSLLANWKLTVLSFFFTVYFSRIMPISPIRVTFFFSVHSR